MRPLAAVAAVCAVVVLGEALAGGTPLPRAPRCPVFPANGPWHQRVDGLPVAEGSGRIVRRVGAGANVHPDFGSGLYDGGPIGIPYTVVGRRQRRVPVRFLYADESDRGPYPIPRNAPIEGGRRSDGDRHVLVVDRDRCMLYELFDARPVRGARRWRAGSGAVFDMRSNRLRPAGHTSADAAGLPILPGLVRYDEVARGRIDHPIRMTVPETRRAYVYPARHFASDSDDPNLPPMGMRFRLRAGIDPADFPPQARVVVEALQRYGTIVADNGSAWFLTGAPDRRWDNDDLRSLRRLEGRDFEVVDTGSLPTPGLRR